MNIKLLVLAAFFVGSTVGAMVASQTAKGTGGCIGTATDGDSAADVPDNGTTNANTNSAAGNANDNSGNAAGNLNTNSDSAGNANSNANANTNTNSGGNANSNTNTNGGGGPIALTGTYSGTIVCATSQRIGETNTQPRNRNLFMTLNFDAQGLPVDLPILGFSGAPDTRVAIQTVGEQATTTAQSSNLAITTVARVTEATYTATSARIVLAITYTGQSATLNQTGTATETIDVSVNGNTLTFSLDIVYNVIQSANGLRLDTGETHDCNGSLTRQAPSGSGGSSANTPTGG
jgi:hypothetical protein